MSLTDQERSEIADEIREHLHMGAHKRAACVEALKIVQRRRGWISDEICDIAEMLDLTADEVDSIATFYSFIFRRPVGKHLILICDSVCCWTVGYEQIRDHLYARLGIRPGETSADGQFTLLPVSCLGACDHAPAMIIDEDLHGDLDPAKVDEILRRYME